MKKYVTIFPFVHINIKHTNTLFYNTISGHSAVFISNEFVAQLANTLLKSNYACLVEDDQINELKQYDFFNLLLKNNLGYYIDAKKLHELPFTTQCIDINDERVISNFKMNENILENIREITLYLNNFTNAKSHSLNKAHQQFLYPIYEEEKKELDMTYIKVILNKFENNPLNLNIIGGNILKYSNFKELTKELNNSWHNTFYYFHYSDLIASRNKKLFSSINNKAVKIILIDFPLLQAEFIKWKDAFREENVKVEFIVEGESQIIEAEEVISQFDITNYMFRPYYNETNIEFFKENVFVNEEDIRKVKEDLFTLVTKKISNPVFFGKLIFNTDGQIFTNFNFPAIGNIKESNIEKLVFDLLEDANSPWRVNKPLIHPCNNCIYNILCPPISNYEFALKRNNFISVR
jgi:pseudo-rSAM protein